MALRTTGTEFQAGGDEEFVRDAFDGLFDGFERLEYFIEIKLIVFPDVEQSLSYYVGKLSNEDERPVIELFLRAYYPQAAKDFLTRFPSWGGINNARRLSRRPWSW